MMNIHSCDPGSDRQRYTSLNENGSDDEHLVKLSNPNISLMPEDVLYHFALGTKSHDLKAMFGDVKFVCVGGSPRRMERFAQFMLTELGVKIPAGQALINISGATDRYAMYKVGQVLSVSHGIGIPSLSIVMHELLKVMYYAGVDDVQFIRIGTSGGIGLDPGTVVVSTGTVDALLRPILDLAILGKLVSRPAALDQELAKEIISCGSNDDEFKTVGGTTMCTLDFYEGQGRLDGAFCEYDEKEKMDYLKDIYEKGVRNIEMESLCFAAMCHKADVKCAVVCATLLNRLNGDQVDSSREQLQAWDQRPSVIVSRHIKKRLAELAMKHNSILNHH